MLDAQWQQVRRAFVVRLDNIGDLVMLGPALRTIKQHLPHVHLTLLASPAGSQVAPLLPWVDEVMVQRAVWQDASAALPLDPAREQALVEQIGCGAFDAAFIFTSFTQSPYPPAFACYLAGVPLRLGQSREFGGSLLTHWIKPLPDDAHQVDRNLHLLDAVGFVIGSRALELHVADQVQQQADELLAAAGVAPSGPFIATAPGASCPSRRYDLKRFAEVLRLVAEEGDGAVVLLGSEREQQLLEPLVQAIDGQAKIRSLVGRTSLPQLVAILSRARLVLANNSGPMHIADAFRRPQVILYSGTDLESQWRPRNSPARLLRRPTDCAPCYGFQCPYNMECLDLPAEEVAQAALGLLAQTAGAAAG